MKNIRIVVIDHQALFREGIKRALNLDESFKLLASSEDFSIVTPLSELGQIDVLIIDSKSVNTNITQIKALLKDQQQACKVIVLSTEAEAEFVTEAIAFGVSGYVLREMGVHAFIDAIKQVHAGTTYIHPRIAIYLVRDYRNLSLVEKKQTPHSATNVYTKRESEVLQLLAYGKSNRHIAASLNISEKTVKNHVSSLFKKMKVNDRTKAVIMAIRNNWVSL